MTAPRQTTPQIESKSADTDPVSLKIKAFDNSDLIALTWRIIRDEDAFEAHENNDLVGSLSERISYGKMSWMNNFRALSQSSEFIDFDHCFDEHKKHVIKKQNDLQQQEDLRQLQLKQQKDLRQLQLICENKVNPKEFVWDDNMKKSLVDYIISLSDVDFQEKLCRSILEPGNYKNFCKKLAPLTVSRAAEVMWWRRGIREPDLTRKGSQLNRIFQLHQKILSTKTTSTVASHQESKSELGAAKLPAQVQRFAGDGQEVLLSQSRLGTFHRDKDMQEMSVITITDKVKPGQKN